MTRHISSAVVVALLLGAAGMITAQEVTFRSFSEVETVCPTCEPPFPHAVHLRDGRVLHVQIVSENPTFYVALQYGEARAIGTAEVSNIEWGERGRPSGLSDHDQILLANGHVLFGEIVEESESPPQFLLYSPFYDQTYTVAKEQARLVYRSGRRYSF